METRSANSLRRAFPGFLAVLVLAGGGLGCWPEAESPPNQHSEKALAQRAQLYWDLKTSGDIMGSYEIMAESYRRRVTPAGFARIGSGLVVHTGATVESVKMNDMGAEVAIELRHYLNRPAFRDMEQVSRVIERWVFENGAWYRWPMGMARGINSQADFSASSRSQT
ncbi:MAG: hypothetical protein VCC00_00660 [Deltaproteobacteria bacterium]|jgi:hypothetical protein